MSSVIERIAATRTGFRELFDSAGSEFIEIWPSLPLPVRVSMTLAAIEELELDADCADTLAVAAPELFATSSDDDTDAAPPPIALVSDSERDANATTLAQLLHALRNCDEHNVQLWPPAADFEANVAEAIGAAAAATAMTNLKHARSNILLQTAINLMLIRVDDDDANDVPESI